MIRPYQSQSIAKAQGSHQAIPTIVLIAFGAAFFLLTLRLGASPAGDLLDPSWAAAISHAFKNGAAWGRDIVFPYGPLGFLHAFSPYDPDLFPLFLTGQIIVGLLISTLIAMSLRSLTTMGVLGFALSALAIAPALWGDVLFIFAATSSLLVLLPHVTGNKTDDRLETLKILIGSLTLATLALIKINMLFPALTYWATISFLYLKKEKPSSRAAAMLAFPVFLLGIWLASRQDLSDLPTFLATSLHSVSQYTQGMSLAPSLADDAIGLIFAALAAALFLAIAWPHRRETSILVSLAYMALCLFMAWRSGFTRADAHILTFYASLPLISITLLALPVRNATRYGALALSAACLVCYFHYNQKLLSLGPAASPTIAAHQIWSSIRFLSNPNELTGIRESERMAAEEQHGLPKIRSIVGNASIDMFGSQQGVLIANNLDYSPRPTIQSYAAYSPKLAELNRRHYSNHETSPRFVLIGATPIDNHLFASEDPLSLMEILKSYGPVTMERSFLLMRRLPADPGPADKVAHGSARIGEWISIPATRRHGYVTLKIDIRRSVLGTVASTLIREPALNLEYVLSDGTVLTYRLIRGNANSGFIVNPLLRSGEDIVRLYFDTPLQQVAQVRLVPSSRQGAFHFKDTFDYSLDAGSLPHSAVEQARTSAWNILYPGFSHVPTSQTGLVTTTNVNGQTMVFAHADASLDFSPGTGSFRIVADVGVDSEIALHAECNNADGVQFQLTKPGLDEPLAALHVAAPRTKAPANTSHALQADHVTTEAGEIVRLEVLSGPPGSSSICDWAFINGFRIDVESQEQ